MRREGCVESSLSPSSLGTITRNPVPRPIKPLQKTSLVDEVVAALRDQIADGHIRPGETLRIEGLAREFGVSRTPIREAFSKLEVEGLLVRKTGYAATVFTPVRREVREYYEMRIVLEPLAARLALANMTPAVERRLTALVSKMDDFTANNWFAINREFHDVLYEPSDRPFLRATIDNLIQRSDPYIRMYFETHDLEDTQREHRQILVSLGERDEQALSAAVEEHLTNALSEIVAVVSDDESQ
jgi:DNA-binding GntR family transcriptional regulator